MSPTGEPFSDVLALFILCIAAACAFSLAANYLGGGDDDDG
jgi:hypothetical protein